MDSESIIRLTKSEVGNISSQIYEDHAKIGKEIEDIKKEIALKVNQMPDVEFLENEIETYEHTI